MTQTDYTYDWVVVGSGGGGMTSALKANHLGMSVLVIEKTGYFGGSTARSGGAIWVPNNYLLKEEGIPDSHELAAEYMAHVVGDRVPQKLQEAYLTHAPHMVEWLRDHTCVRFQRMPNYADYYPERPGGSKSGRSLEPIPFDGNKLGNELAYLRKPMAEVPSGLPLTGSGYQKIGMVTSTWEGKKAALKLGVDWIRDKLRGVWSLTMGQALSGSLRYAMMQAGIPLWLNTPFQDLILEDDRVVGIMAIKDGELIHIKARRGVLLAAGGFAHNLAMRQEFHPAPITTEWTVASEGNTGDAILAGIKQRAATDLMDDAWWGPTSQPPGETPFFHVAERAYPGSLIINRLGQRFVNESAPYVDVVHTIYAKHSQEASHIPAYFIFDQRYRRKYLFGMLFPGTPVPKRYFENGYFQKARSIEALAEKIGVDCGNLTETIARFNRFAQIGRDEDFGRGESAYDNYYGDPTVLPNPNLAPLVKPPFYAVKLWPGDLGTKGGLVTDEWGRVLKDDREPINGLYATGNTTASPMGNSYPGAGATIGPAMTFGYLAAQHAAFQAD